MRTGADRTPAPRLRSLARRNARFLWETAGAGDEVWAYDLVNGRWCARTVLQRYVNDHDGTSATITVADEEIEATFLHPFWVVSGEDLAGRPVRGHLPRVPEGATTPGRWVDAGDVRVGDQLLLRDGRILPAQAIRHQPYNDKVYNIHVDDFQCYAVGVNGVLVHNQNGIDPVEAEGGIPTIGGRNPINSSYAGEVHPSGVRFTEQGFPDLSPYSKAEVELEGLTGNYAKDAAMANKAVGLGETPEGYVWHHVEDGRTMQLVPQDVHNAARHTGGAAVIRNGGFD